MQAVQRALDGIPEKTYYRIGEVAKHTGIKPYVLRFWETEFKMMMPPKSRSRQRMYQTQGHRRPSSPSRSSSTRSASRSRGARKRLVEIMRVGVARMPPGQGSGTSRELSRIKQRARRAERATRLSLKLNQTAGVAVGGASAAVMEFVTTGSECEERLRAADFLRAPPLLRGGLLLRGVPLRADAFFRAPVFFRTAFFRAPVFFRTAFFRAPVFFRTAFFRAPVFFRIAFFRAPVFFRAFFRAPVFFRTAFFRAPVFFRTAFFRAPVFFRIAFFRAPVFFRAFFRAPVFFRTAFFRAPVFFRAAFFLAAIPPAPLTVSRRSIPRGTRRASGRAPPTFAQAYGLRCARRYRGACRVPSSRVGWMPSSPAGWRKGTMEVATVS